ncbi:MAG: hypothetical protein KF833_18440, partial [Verrucomicrobiae bacterium]|nr:hypothetical protein [Verrucomicrobiae bacterium]
RELQAGQDGQLPIAHGWSVWRASANRESDPKARTLAGYEAMWRRFQGWAGKSGIAHLHEASRAHAEAYAEDLWNSGVSPSTFNQHIKLLRPAFL